MLLVETTGPFMLTDPLTKTEIQWNRPTVVRDSYFIHARASIGQISVLLNDVPDHITDDDFVGFYTESLNDKELAVASFHSWYSAEPEFNLRPPSVKTNKRRGSRANEKLPG